MANTIVLSRQQQQNYLTQVKFTIDCLEDTIICQDTLQVLSTLPPRIFPLIICDPPYNLTKQYADHRYAKRPRHEYLDWVQQWLPALARVLTTNGSIYVCSDWQSSGVIEEVLSAHFKIRNRITWSRNKGRGAAKNWKNVSEDIWFATTGNAYTFNVDAVKCRKKVIAPYRNNGVNKDWTEDAKGKYRMTHPANVWSDIVVPFWSMPENTLHPTQKPEKLLAKLILASSNPDDLVFDPFCGVGSTCVTAKKLGRHYCGIEQQREYCAYAMHRLHLASTNLRIQGFENNTFIQ